jgi:hypothetical protein
MHRITYPYNCPPLMVQKWGSIPHEVGCFRFLAGIVLEMVALGLGRENENGSGRIKYAWCYSC